MSFDNFIPGSPGNPGVNSFTIGNLTGDPATGGNAVPPTFPVLTLMTFKNGSLQLFSGGSSQTLTLGDIGPGFFSSNALQFPDTKDFSSAIFSATLDATFLQLDGGASFTASSDQVSVLLVPLVGSSLVAGTDLALIEVSNETPSEIPEPSSAPIVLTLVLLLFWLRRRKAAT